MSRDTTWYIFDGLGSVVAEADDSGTVTATKAYDVYGIPRGGNGTSSTKHGFVGSLGHTTEPDTGGLIYMRARWMDPLTGRFISEDPAQNGSNWFVYCGNNPVNLFDPSGQMGMMTGTWLTIAAWACLTALAIMAIEVLVWTFFGRGNPFPPGAGGVANPRRNGIPDDFFRKRQLRGDASIGEVLQYIMDAEEYVIEQLSNDPYGEGA